MTRLCRAKEKILCSCECAKNIFNDTGDNGEGETPVPIPNTAVKPFCAESTELDTTWEGRTLPVTKRDETAKTAVFFLLVTTRQRPSRVATQYGIASVRRRKSEERTKRERLVSHLDTTWEGRTLPVTKKERQPKRLSSFVTKPERLSWDHKFNCFLPPWK